MSIPGPPDVRLFLTDYLKRKLAGTSQAFTVDLTDDCDPLLPGIIDSLGHATNRAVVSRRAARCDSVPVASEPASGVPLAVGLVLFLQRRR